MRRPHYNLSVLVLLAACKPTSPAVSPEPAAVATPQPPPAADVQAQQTQDAEDEPSEAEMEQVPVTDEDAGEVEDPSTTPVKRETRPKPAKKGAPQQAMMPLGMLGSLAPAPANLKLHFIDIGQGDATLIECPNGNKILVDAGSKTGGANRAKNYLHSKLQGDKVDDLVITHGDGDHYNAAKFMMTGVTVDQVWLVGGWNDYVGQANQEGKTWLQAMEQAGKVTRLDANGPYFDASVPNPGLDCGPAQVWIAAAGVTGTRSDWRKNTASIVLVVSYGSFDAIITGDATRETEKQMVDWHCGTDWTVESTEACWLQSEVLKLGHHGSGTTSTGAEWAKAVAPNVAIASATRTKMFGHPNKKAVTAVEPYTDSWPAHRFLQWRNKSTPEYLDQYTEAVFSTAIDGNIVVESDGSSYWVTP